MLKKSIVLLALVGIVAAGWASNLFWFGVGQFVTGFTTLVTNCSRGEACATGAVQLVFGAIAAGVGAGYYWKFGSWKRDAQGVYHLYEPGHPEVADTIFQRSTYSTSVGFDVLKTVHTSKANEARIVYHHKDGSLRAGLYHFNNETQHHHFHASFATDKDPHNIDLLKREDVNGNTGFGAAFNDLDAGTWANVDHANNDEAYWISHTMDQMRNNDGDSFCMGFDDPDNGNEHVGALRVQPATGDNYGGVNFNPCGSDNFKKRRFSRSPALNPARQVSQLRQGLADFLRPRTGAEDSAHAEPDRRALSCVQTFCDVDQDCYRSDCRSYECGPNFTCELVPECGGRPSTC
ncbi:hypothetical protein OC842_002334 [Tilletia horrida]|uniref:Uncharacterized protein n=1 Tax=Tilletia horrida TaxID=155126 RepID=A0AAN6GI47_9BASI|nr:hypothetical protein OC842_002334 [Tilletia horrida]